MFERSLLGLVMLAVVSAGCGGSNTQTASPVSAPPQSSVVVPAAPSSPPVAACPAGSQLTGATCVYTDVSCPRGSTRMQNTCIGDVTCPGGTAWDGGTCRPGAAAIPTASASTTTNTDPSAARPTSLAAPPPGSCFLNLNSLPASQVQLDGVALGWTPRLHTPARPGSHMVVFTTGHEKKTLSITCTAGETKAVLAKLTGDDPGY